MNTEVICALIAGVAAVLSALAERRPESAPNERKPGRSAGKKRAGLPWS